VAGWTVQTRQAEKQLLIVAAVVVSNMSKLRTLTFVTLNHTVRPLWRCHGQNASDRMITGLEIAK